MEYSVYNEQNFNCNWKSWHSTSCLSCVDFPNISNLSLWCRELPLLNPHINSLAAPPQNKTSLKMCIFQVVVSVFAILNVATTAWSLCFLLCGCSGHHCFHSTVCSLCYRNSVILLNSQHTAQQNTSHTSKRTHRTPPKHLAVSMVRCHENPRSRSLFEPTSQVHLHSSNLPNTFCSLSQCLSQTVMHNISVMGKQRHNTSPNSLTKYRVHPFPGSACSKRQVHYGNCSFVFGLMAVSSELYSHTNFPVSLSALWLIPHAHTDCLASLYLSGWLYWTV